MLFNPVIVAVVILCALCLAKMNILLAMIISLFAGGLAGGLGLKGTMSSLLSGLGSNGETALAYILLGTFATAMATTGIVDILGQKMTKFIGNKKLVFLWTLAFIACLSQNAIPVHIAFIPILIPPLLILMNKLKIDRRAAACSLAFGLKAPYITLPVGFGLIFHGIVAKNMTTNGMPVDVKEVWRANWILGLAMFIGLCIAVFFTYRKPRDYQNVQIIEHEIPQELKFERHHWFTLVTVIVMVILQIQFGSLPIAALGGLLLLIITGTIKWNQIDAQFEGGIKLMGFIAFVMLVAGGFAQVLKDTGAVDELVKNSIGLMGGNKLIAATMITLIGLLVTMGIGTSFGTIPVLAVLYVPLCQQIGFSTPATILLISAAAALGDAGSPASDTTLGPTSGLNADGQHDHIWDTCVPTFLHFNIPLMIAAIIGAQFI
ncbi:Na+/H+ antiporter family protein [Oscillospiraceae bacterium LTW-04]|nr:SLC13 family permease [Oscillospiraceae bacterium MB24-C1]